MYELDEWTVRYAEPEGTIEAYRAADRMGPMTIEEFERLPDEEYRCDLVRGWLVREPPAGARHGAIAIELARALANHVKAAVSTPVAKVPVVAVENVSLSWG